jgi:hypothetical protein
MHQHSGPFLSDNKAHYDLASSCLNYMNSSTCFIDPTFSKDTLKIKVLKGFHGLHHYANEFWFQHLFQYARWQDPVDDEDLDEPLQEVEGFFWKQTPGVAKLKLDDTTSTDGIRSQLEVFDILTFRKFLSQEKYSHQGPESMDPVS